MDVSGLGNSTLTAARPSADTTSESRLSASTETQGQVTQEAQTSAVPPVQAASDLGGEEGSVVTQESNNSADAQASSTESGAGSQVDVLA